MLKVWYLIIGFDTILKFRLRFNSVQNVSQEERTVQTFLKSNHFSKLSHVKFSTLENEKSDFEKVININLLSAFLGTKHAAKVMIPKRYGTIITTASICSAIGGSASDAYTSSKHGVIGLMRNTAVDLGRYGI